MTLTVSLSSIHISPTADTSNKGILDLVPGGFGSSPEVPASQSEFLTSSSNSYAALFMYLSLMLQTDSMRKKKKRKGSQGGQGGQQNDNDVDANEPTYCTCKCRSYGSMVACDNQDCAIEWFHYECVGLKCAPGDPWFCPACAESTISTVAPDESGKVKIEPTANNSLSGGGQEEDETLGNT